MKHLRIALPLALTLLLAACGGDGPTPTPPAPPVEQPPVPPVAPPVTPDPPAPPVAPAPPPDSAPTVPYGGEWVWEFESEYGFADQGTISIFDEDRDDDEWEGSWGYWQSCYAGTCFNRLEGIAYVGLAPVEGEGVQLVTFLLEENLAGDAEYIYATIDDDKELEKDSQNRDEIIGEGFYERYGGALFGDGYTVLIGQDRLFGPLNNINLETIRSAKQFWVDSHSR